jgi:hypothetical protein
VVPVTPGLLFQLIFDTSHLAATRCAVTVGVPVHAPDCCNRNVALSTVAPARRSDGSPSCTNEYPAADLRFSRARAPYSVDGFADQAIAETPERRIVTAAAFRWSPTAHGHR